MALGNLGVIAHREARYDEAARCYAAQLDLGRRVGDRRLAAQSLANLALVDCARGRYARAERRLREALALRQATGDRLHEASALLYLGHLERQRGRLREARRYVERALAMHRALGARRMVGADLVELGITAGRAGDHGRALAAFGQGIDLLREVGDAANEADGLGERARLLAAMGRGGEALADARRAAALYAGSRGLKAARVRALLGDLLLLGGDPSAALAEAEAALAASSEILRNTRGVSGARVSRCVPSEPSPRAQGMTLFGRALPRPERFGSLHERRAPDHTARAPTRPEYLNNLLPHQAGGGTRPAAPSGAAT